ncbi:hypothetical protein [Hymenobacter cellulosivorans]|uniref:DUF4468 domain-containing protein n=1 Tax=Hymenobacter cellulosivorans TaxID=2932249 RepID=A0ABY4FD30_9BACT|nr:hypothetical protein [Hymenobacter cellulosivorans]UOQ54373.1 hypothetical protein MUN80_06335 [Hymenobacter cellulosivorans]
MKHFFYAATFLLPFGAAAQQAPPPASAPTVTAADTAVYRYNRYISFMPGTLRLMDGSTVPAYVPVPTVYPGIDYTFIYYLGYPKSKPKPAKKEMQVAQLQSMTAGSHYFEPMRVPGEKKIKILAERFVNGPVEVFLQAEAQRVPVPIPVAGAILHTAVPYTNSHFFVRRNGLLMQVDRSSFKDVMSQYLQDYPALATKVRAGEKDYHYRNLIAIITEFNAHLSSTPTQGQ